MDIQTLIRNVLSFLSDSVVPLIIALALVAFIWYIAQYFIFQGTSDEGQEKGKRYLLWGIIGFVVIISLAGIVNLLVRAFGFGTPDGIIPDYMCDKLEGSQRCLDGTQTDPTGGTNMEGDGWDYSDTPGGIGA